MQRLCTWVILCAVDHALQPRPNRCEGGKQHTLFTTHDARHELTLTQLDELRRK
jgi:hypothetical protein